MYEIRFAHETESEALVEFIDQHWRKNHIFVTCKELLDWQHLDSKRQRYNFVIGVERQTQAVHGILGFIPLTQFDPGIQLERLCWMAIWKVQDAARGHKLGRRLMSFLQDAIGPEIISTVAASAMTLPMYQALGYQTGRLSHHFILNPTKSVFQLAVTNPGDVGHRFAQVDLGKRLEEASEGVLSSAGAGCFHIQPDLPRKSPTYLINRYLRHPIYRYQAYSIRDGTKTVGIVVTRICNHEGSRAVRIVDFVGRSESLRGLREQWTLLLRSIDAEYLDFYCAGIDENDLAASGFTRRIAGDGMVIPNYFEPFSRENVEIDYMVSVPGGQPFRIVKGDSDQDRPNLMK